MPQTIDGIISEGPSYFPMGLDGKPDNFSLHRCDTDFFFPCGLPGQVIATTGASGISQISAVPLIVTRPNALIDAIKIDVTVAAGAGGTLRMGIYASDPRTLIPSTLILDTGTTANDAAAGARVFPINFAITPSKLFWAVVNTEVSGCTYRSHGTASPMISPFGVTQATSGSPRCWAFNNAGPYAALPAIFPTVGSSLNALNSGTPPYICVRFAR